MWGCGGVHVSCVCVELTFVESLKLYYSIETDCHDLNKQTHTHTIHKYHNFISYIPTQSSTTLCVHLQLQIHKYIHVHMDTYEVVYVCEFSSLSVYVSVLVQRVQFPAHVYE